jgi:hypothetical protein
MNTEGVERREFQRLPLDSPVSGTFDSVEVSVVDIGILGARIEHAAPFADPRGELRFHFGGNDIGLRCDVTRTTGSEGSLASGLRFLAAVGDSGDHLRGMLAQLVNRALQHLHDASATRLRIRGVADGDKTVRGTDANFVSYRLENGAWRKRSVFLPEQPPAGFTVARHEDPQEMQRLCEVYEASDEEGRRLIRMFAELSVSDALQIPPRS